MKLTAENVTKIASECFYEETELTDGIPEDAVMVEGIVNNYGFHPERLNSRKADIASMLNDLDDSFMSGKGGGMSFLNACYTKDGVHWGEHSSIGLLFALGMGLGMVSYSLPREVWSALPGGMPYMTVDSGHI